MRAQFQVELMAISSLRFWLLEFVLCLWIFFLWHWYLLYVVHNSLYNTSFSLLLQFYLRKLLVNHAWVIFPSSRYFLLVADYRAAVRDTRLLLSHWWRWLPLLKPPIFDHSCCPCAFPDQCSCCLKDTIKYVTDNVVPTNGPTTMLHTRPVD